MAEPTHTRIVLGTAGHIDHGKTSLVKALTGVDTDRLKEEKERGITIELGFASLKLPDGRKISVVDVPGHERFVRNMVAGASGIDFVVFVLAADEGVMPQTREHLDICSLLGIRAGVVAITKADLVEPGMAELAAEEFAELASGTFLDGAAMIPVSSVTGQGLPELLAEISNLASSLGQRDAKGLFRLPIDRVFTIKGFGTVVTGTALSGAVRRDDEVEALPSGARAKVRSIEVHGEQVEKGYAGSRLALNFAGVGVDELKRGDTVVHPGAIATTRMADAKITLLPAAKKPLGPRSRFRLHVDAREAPVVVALLDRKELMPGDSAFVQLRLPEPIVVCPGDRFVLRGYSPSMTLGGGRILDAAPRRHKGLREEVVKTLEALDKGDEAERLAAFLKLRGAYGLTPAQTQVALGVTLDEARNLLQGAVRSGKALVAERKRQLHVETACLDALAAPLIPLLSRYHAEYPLRKGMAAEELRTKLPAYLDKAVAAFALERMAERGEIVFEGDTARLASFTAKLNLDDEELRGKVLSLVREAGFEAPTVAEISAALSLTPAIFKPVLDYMVAQGMLVRTKESFLFDPALLAGLAEKVIDRMADTGELTVADIKDFTGATRKYVIPLAEYLDNNKITFRQGDKRVPGPKGRKS